MRPVRGGVQLAGGGAPTGVVGHGGGHHPARLWRTPTPYLFLGFAVMMGLIAVALLVLICTRRKPAGSSSSRRGSGAAEESSARALAPLDREPKVVVIMPGDDAPSFLACTKPLAFAAAVVSAGAELRPKPDDSK